MDVSFQAESKFALTLPLCSVPALKGLLSPLALGTVILTWSTDSNATLFLRHPHRLTQKLFLPALWASFSPAKMTHELNYHS